MKSLLVPVEDTDRVSAALNLARAFATTFDGRVDGVALRLAQFQAVGAEPVVAVTVPAPGANDQQIAARAHARFDAFVAQADAQDQYRWRTGDPVDDQGLGALARVYDAVVVGRPGSADAATRMTTFEAALFDGGRPLLIAPPQFADVDPANRIGRHVVVSWNQSTEAARTLAVALPVLAQAQTVTVLAIDTALVPGPSVDDVARYLDMHGITARVVARSAKGQGSNLGPGKAILAAAADLDADLLVKSAYTQSRLRQMIFGGATSEILTHATIPVLMAN